VKKIFGSRRKVFSTSTPSQQSFTELSHKFKPLYIPHPTIGFNTGLSEPVLRSRQYRFARLGNCQYSLISTFGQQTGLAKINSEGHTQLLVTTLITSLLLNLVQVEYKCSNQTQHCVTINVDFIT